MANVSGGLKSQHGQLSKEFEDVGIDQASFEALEKEFQELLEDIAHDENLEKFRLEYEKLYRAFKTSFESEKRLVRRCKDLNDTILANTTKVRTAIQMTQEDSSTIANLKQEVDKAWTMIEKAKEKEDKARKMIQDLKTEISNLNKIVEKGSGLSIGPDSTVHELMRNKEDLQKSNKAKDEQIKGLEERIDSLIEEKKKKENDVLKEQTTVMKLQEEKDRMQGDIDREARRKKNLLAETFNYKEKITEKDKKIEDLEELNRKTNLDKEAADERNKKMEENNTKLQENLGLYSDKIKELADKVENYERIEKNLFLKMKLLEGENYEKKLKTKELEKNLMKVERENSSLKNKTQILDTQKNQSEQEKKIIYSSVNHLEREIDILKKQADMDKSQIESLAKEKNILLKSIKKAENSNLDQRQNAENYKNQKQNAEMELQNKRKETQQLMEEKKKLEKEKDKYGHEASQAIAKYTHCLEEVKLKDNLIQELQKKIIEGDARLKQQQNLYEAVRSDRNLYSKNLIEAQDEVAEIKRKFNIATHQISQLKDEMDAKEAALTKEHYDSKKIAKENDKWKSDFKKLENKIKVLTEAKQRDEIEIAKLKFIIKQAETERKKQEMDYESVITERDIFGTQLIRRNDELALLYEKIKILQSTLSKGELQYQERIGDIALLKDKIANLQRELAIAKNKAAGINDLKNEVFDLQRQLLQERLQVKALSEELENPMNVHRWRKIEGTDPDTYEMTQKIHTLQKRLIKKTEEVVEKDVIVQDKEKLILELKNILARQPGPEVAEQLSIYQQNLKEKTKQMKAMAAELNMYQAQVNEYKYEIERLTRELQETKTKYYEQKRREQLQREAHKQEPKIKQNMAPMQRFTGGGFNLAV